MNPPFPEDLPRQVAAALAEDIGSGDLTAQLIDAQQTGRAVVITRETTIVCGRPYVEATFRALDPQASFQWRVAEGAVAAANQPLFEVSGNARALLTGERTALNFLQLLSGTASVVRAYAQKIADTPCRLLDTRKTVPGLRSAQKYAVRIGGGQNHRIGLFDGILIKENHILAAGSIAAAVAAAKQSAAGVPIEVEVENLQELRQAIAARADVALLDNFDLQALREGVALNAAHGGMLKLEASGGATLETVRAIALTGVDFISVGALTKNVGAVDLSMRFQFA